MIKNDNFIMLSGTLWGTTEFALHLYRAYGIIPPVTMSTLRVSCDAIILKFMLMKGRKSFKPVGVFQDTCVQE